MLKKETGIVLRSSRSGSSSRMITFLGADSGKIRLLAKGALKKESPFRGLIEPGSIIEVVYYFKEGREVYFAREISPLGPAPAGGASLDGLAARFAALELVDGISFPGDPDARVWEILASYLARERPRDPLVLFLAFEVKLLGALGALPEFGLCSLCGGPAVGGVFDPAGGVSFCARERPGSGDHIPLARELIGLLEQAERCGFAELASIKLDGAMRKTFGRLMHWTYTYHVQGYRLPNSLKLLK